MALSCITVANSNSYGETAVSAKRVLMGQSGTSIPSDAAVRWVEV
jgi:hypothetical protein